MQDVLALGVTGTAVAAYATPKMTVTASTAGLGVNTPLSIRVEQSREDDATFRLAIYVPQGYVAQLTATEGTQLGTVAARVQANAISPDAIALTRMLRFTSSAPSWRVRACTAALDGP